MDRSLALGKTQLPVAALLPSARLGGQGQGVVKRPPELGHLLSLSHSNQQFRQRGDFTCHLLHALSTSTEHPCPHPQIPRWAEKRQGWSQ